MSVLVNKKTAVLCLDGFPPSQKLLEYFWSVNSLKIAADGSYHYLKKYNFIPNIVIGDFDSIDIKYLKKDFQGIIKEIPNQDTTDSEKCFDWLLSQKYKVVHVLGATGKNTDHLLYNLSLLRKYHFSFHSITFWTENEEIFLIHQDIKLQGKVSSHISLIPIFGTVLQVSTKNFQYNLQKQDLSLGFQSSISNKFSAPEVEIYFKKGFICIFKEHSQGQLSS